MMSQEKDQEEFAADDVAADSDDMGTGEAGKLLEMARVVPIHAATAPAKRGPGRPRKINPKPTPDDLLYHAEMQRQMIAFIEADEMVRATATREGSPILHVLRHKMARNAAALEFQRVELQKYGRIPEAAQLVSRHSAVVKQLSEIEADLNKRSNEVIDLRSDKIQQVYKLWIERIQGAASEVLSKESLDLFFNRLETSMDGWEDEAESRLR